MKIKDERIALENMINQASDTIDGNVPKAGEIPELKNKLAFEFDYDMLEKSCNKQAKRMIKNATGFVLSDEHIKNNPYLKDKMLVDIISLGGMLYQMECTKVMQKSLMSEVQHGAQHPRMFEVFSGLVKVISDINKQLLQTVEAIKVTYLDLKENMMQFSEKKAISDGGISRNDKGIIALGTKDLIKQTKQLKIQKMKTNDIEDIEIIENII